MHHSWLTVSVTTSWWKTVWVMYGGDDDGGRDELGAMDDWDEKSEEKNIRISLTEWSRKFIPKARRCIRKWAISDLKKGRWGWSRELCNSRWRTSFYTRRLNRVQISDSEIARLSSRRTLLFYYKIVHVVQNNEKKKKKKKKKKIHKTIKNKGNMQ